MTKSDLRSGMVVETRNGRNYMVSDFGGKLFGCGSSVAWVDFDRYTDSMKINDEKEYRTDIMKVYAPSCIGLPNETFRSAMALIWEREEKRKLTVSQIEEILGYGIEIVAESSIMCS